MVPGVGCTPRKQKLQRSSSHTGHDSLNPPQQLVKTAAHAHAKDVSFTNRECASECARQTHLLKVV